MSNPLLPCFAGILSIAALTATPGCGNSDGEPVASSHIERINRSLSAAASFLIGQQAVDGAWRPDTYGTFKDGPSLTPLVLRALLATCPSQGLQPACRKAADY